MIKLGLCCSFKKEPIRFRTTTAAYLMRCKEPLAHLNSIVAHNIEALEKATNFCKRNGIGAFRINSDFLPVCTHPEVAYQLEDLPDGKEFKERLSRDWGVRLSFHPDQFVVLSSPKEKVCESSINELEYHGEIAELVNADVINIHAGGAYDSKEEALLRFASNFEKLSERVQKRLTIENDDRTYTVEDLLPLCKRLSIPLVYDVHHHRCNRDHFSIEEATEAAISTWNREPLFHISSPLGGWKSKTPQKHSDYISIEDFPRCWLPLDLTVDVEAKAKELAVIEIKNDLQKLII